MKPNNELKKGDYCVPFESRYIADDSTSIDDLFERKAESLGEKIKGLYGHLYERKKINYKLIYGFDADILETSSELVAHSYNPFLSEKQTSNLERRLDLLEKSKRSELVDFWRDVFKLDSYIFEAKQEYKALRDKLSFIK
jgi:hypothetical protein